MAQIRDHIILKLRQIRDEKGTKQKEIAEYLHVSPGAVSNWFKGDNCIDIDNLYSLCQYWNVPLSYFLPIGSEELSDDEHHLVVIYRGADDRAREDAIDTLAKHQKQDMSGDQTVLSS